MMYSQTLCLYIDSYKMNTLEDAIIKTTCSELTIRNRFYIFKNTFIKVAVLKRLLLTSNSSYIEFLKLDDV